MPNTPSAINSPPHSLPELQGFGGPTLHMPNTPWTSSPQSTAGGSGPQSAIQHQGMQTDPLAELRDIHVHADISSWPPAYGWWILFFIAAVAIFVLIGAAIQRSRRNAYKKAADRKLKAIKDSYHMQADTQMLINELSILLKRICLTRHARHEVAGLSGQKWLAFLDKTGNTNEFTAGCGQALANHRFMPNTDDVDGQELILLCERWVKQQ